MPEPSRIPGLPPGSPAAIGPFRIDGVLGAGGMGVVYDAHQTGPIERRVALKVFQAGAGSDLWRRQALERDAISRLAHENVAGLLDAGIDDHGRSWLAFEPIAGADLVTFCRERDLPRRARLGLFLQVCRGVQHAHQRGVLHRDLKPGNILVAEVDGRHVPKIIDFGIARLFAEDGAGAAAGGHAAAAGQRVGTPDYMSPEQAGDLQTGPDVRSDVYSLGVVLYELLTGALPWPEGRRDRRHPIPLTAHTARIPLELRCVVQRAIEFDPERRYRTAKELADNVGRHLDGRAVAARPPSPLYLAVKFLHRHRAFAAIAAATAAGLCVTASALTRAAADVELERVRAESAITAIEAETTRALARLDDTERLTSFLAALLMKVQPGALGPDATIPSMLRAAAEDLDRGSGMTVPTRARAAHAIAEPLFLLGDHATSGRLLSPLVEPLAAAQDRADRTLLGEILMRLGYVSSRAGDRLLAERWFERAAELARTAGLEDLGFKSQGAIAQSLSVRGQYRDAIAMYETLLEHPVPAANEVLRAALYGNIGMTMGGMGRVEEGATWTRKAYDIRRRVSPRDPGTWQTGWQLGLSMLENGQATDAAAFLRKTTDAARTHLTGDHPDVLAGEITADYAVARATNDAEVLPRMRGVLQRMRAIGTPPSQIAFNTAYLVGAMLHVGRSGEALEEAERTVQELLVHRDEGHLDVVQLRLQLGSMFSAGGAPAESLPMLTRAYETALASRTARGMAPRIAMAVASSFHRLGRIAERDAWAQQGRALAPQERR